MFLQTATFILALASLATAHFRLKYPEARGDSFLAPASQWIYPCANVNATAETNRTVWPLTGGAVAFNASHEWMYAFINLGLGTGQVSFNISLTPELLNVTGKGVLCLPDLTIPSEISVTEGQNASIQVITVGHSGASLYNCADISFSANAPAVSGDVCKNSTGLSAAIVTPEAAVATNTSTGANATETPSAASGGVSSSMVSAVFVGLGAVVMSYFL